MHEKNSRYRMWGVGVPAWAVTYDCVDPRVTLCHVTGKKTVTIEVAWPALKAHLAHGDSPGACPAP